MTTTYFGPPRPAYSNPPINPQYFQPSRFVISEIALGPTTLVTTSVNHNYVIGQLVRLFIQPTYGTYQLNEVLGYVIAIPTATQITLNINSTGFNAFIPSPSYGPTLPQVVAVGDSGSGIISLTGRSVPSTAIPGSFINISPL
jgi:hypothetical protein